MRMKIVVRREGVQIFEYPVEPDGNGKLVAGMRIAFREFQRLNPTVNLADPRISVKFHRLWNDTNCRRGA